MKLFNFVSVKLTLCLITGILLGFYFLIPLKILGFIVITLILILYLIYLKNKRNTFPYFDIVSYLSIIGLGLFITTLANPKSLSSHYSYQNISTDAVWKVKIREVLKPNSFSDNYIVEAEALEEEPITGKLFLSIQKDSIDSSLLLVDDELWLVSSTITFGEPLNPHQFNFKSYLKQQGVYHQLRVAPKAYYKTVKSKTTLLGLASNFRERLIEKLHKAPFGSEELSIIQALLLGQRNDITSNTYDNYKDAGAVHILAVSGLHVGIILLLLQFLLNPLELLPKGKTVKLVIILLLLWAFAFVAGLSPSIFRAVMMFSFIAYAMYLNRPSNTFNILALSMFFILLLKPLVLFHLGFQMSYAAVFSIVLIYPKLQRFWYPEHWFLRRAWQLLSVSCAAQLGVLPLSLFYFHQFPSLFFISNLVVIPFLGIILGIGILVLVLAQLDTLPDTLVLAYNYLIGKMNTVIAWVAQQEAFVFRDIPFDQIQLLLSYALIMIFIIIVSKATFKNISWFLIVLFTFQSWVIYSERKLSKTEQFILGHQTANTFFLHQIGDDLSVLESNQKPLKRIINNFKIGERINSISRDSLQNVYSIGSKSLFIIDSLNVLPNQNNLDYFLLTQSPQLNLVRVIDRLHPKMILIDGSNYKSYVTRWKETCIKKEIPFHYTGEKGAYYFDLD
ncbi:ComEC/Rec2 family competence protein [Croceitalea vernalis]|uniref:ComEC/Rec2 family competence protein n=1 Tax=Croceitalea vernalis TaxID=3075599 RepID=A0ABU3BD11_9FLAO|nr:ComEC/Rec2 family competence protein [Croceitalea sp. P007]MDT0620028.1 ComEC/Rec2 family competence protein [Croceitalea sp. P007]